MGAGASALSYAVDRCLAEFIANALDEDEDDRLDKGRVEVRVWPVEQADLQLAKKYFPKYHPGLKRPPVCTLKDTKNKSLVIYEREGSDTTPLVFVNGFRQSVPDSFDKKKFLFAYNIHPLDGIERDRNQLPPKWTGAVTTRIKRRLTLHDRAIELLVNLSNQQDKSDYWEFARAEFFDEVKDALEQRNLRMKRRLKKLVPNACVRTHTHWKVTINEALFLAQAEAQQVTINEASARGEPVEDLLEPYRPLGPHKC